VHKQQPLQKLEPPNGVVACVGSLHALGAHDAHTDVTSQDHVHIIGTITWKGNTSESGIPLPSTSNKGQQLPARRREVHSPTANVRALGT
jgi:hypothetical protein